MGWHDRHCPPRLCAVRDAAGARARAEGIVIAGSSAAGRPQTDESKDVARLSAPERAQLEKQDHVTMTASALDADSESGRQQSSSPHGLALRGTQ